MTLLQAVSAMPFGQSLMLRGQLSEKISPESLNLYWLYLEWYDTAKLNVGNKQKSLTVPYHSKYSQYAENKLARILTEG
ncbi:MAG: hypothetical protein JNM09_06505 [Blastocatellia bacterium]|nr:hypothetical protein [Blastocatellia bacterium]